MQSTPRTLTPTLALTLTLGLTLCLPWAQGLCASVPAPAPARAAPPSTGRQPTPPPYSYTSECYWLTLFAYWATYNVWVDRKRTHHGTVWGEMVGARGRALDIPGGHPGNIPIVEHTADAAFGSDGTTISQRSAQEAQENALVTAMDVHDECLQNKGVMTD